MAVREIVKVLGGMEDLTTGVGKEEQLRAGATVQVGKIDIPYALESEAEIADLDVVAYTYARLGNVEYRYDDAAAAGDIKSNVGPGYWIVGGNTELIVAGDSLLAGGNIWPVANEDTKVGDTLTNITAFKFTYNGRRLLYRAATPVTGVITNIGTIDGTVDIIVNGMSITLKPNGVGEISLLSDISSYAIRAKEVVSVLGYYDTGDCEFKLVGVKSAVAPDSVFTHATGTPGVVARVVKSATNNPRAFGMGIAFHDTGVKMQAYFDAAEVIAESISGTDNKTLPDFSDFGLDFGGSAAYYETSVAIKKSRNLRIANVSHYAKSNYAGGANLIELGGNINQYAHEDFEFSSNTWYCNYKCDGLNLIDFLRGTFSGHTAFYNYLNRGFRVAPRSEGSVTSHELVNEGTLSCFQKLFGETYPVTVTFGEAFELNAPDMQMNTLVIGDQFTNIGTINTSAVFIDNFHFYAGDDRRLRVLDKAVYLVNGYFDGNGVEGLGSDTKMSMVRFFSNTVNYKFIELDNLVNVAITDCTFSSTITNRVDQPKMLGGDYASTGVVAGSKIRDNAGENVDVSAQTTVPILVFNFAGETQLSRQVNPEVGDVAEIVPSQIGNDGGAIFTCSYNSVSRTVTAYVKDTSGAPLAWNTPMYVRVTGFNQ